MKTLIDSRRVLAIILLCLGLAQSETVLAQEQPTNGTFKLQKTLNQLLGEQQAKRYRKIIPPDELVDWQVYLPNNDSNELPGVMVYVSPHKSGKIDRRWLSVMDQYNLIYIAANDSGNEVPAKRRMVLAIMAVQALAQQHAFAADPMIISGFSGGGRVASLLSTQYPEVFTGALYICGVDFWDEKRLPDIERLVQNRFVFLTGARDFNRDETRTIHRRYLRAGAQYSKLMVIPGMSHAHPGGAALEEAPRFLLGGD
jgi:predicted esterase